MDILPLPAEAELEPLREIFERVPFGEGDQSGEQNMGDREMYRGTSLIRNTNPPRITIGP